MREWGSGGPREYERVEKVDEAREKEREKGGGVYTDENDGILVEVVVVSVVFLVVEASEQASKQAGGRGQAGWMTREGKGAKREDREGTKGKRVQAGLGSDGG